MEDFFKQFRTNWQNRPEPPFDEKDWDALQKDLDGQAPQRRLVVLPWWKIGIPLVLLLAASNMAFFMEWKHLRQTLKAVEKQRDTIWMTCVEYQTDTVFRERLSLEKTPHFWHRHLIGNQAYDNYRALATPLASRKEGAQPVFDTTTLLRSPSLATNPGLLLTENTPVSAVQNSIFWSDFKPLPLPVLLLSGADKPELPALTLLPLPASKHKKNLKQTLYTLRPKVFAAGIEGGGSYPVQKGVQSQSGYAAGLTASLGFSKHIWLWANAGYFNIHFTADRMGEDIGIPIVQPPSDDFSFLEAEAGLPALQYAIGLAWHFRTDHRFQPLIGAGLGQISKLPYEITYDFVKASEGIEWSIDKQVTPQGLTPGFLLVRTGFDYEIFGRWHWQMMASYRASLNKTAQYFPQVWDLQTGLLYRF